MTETESTVRFTRDELVQEIDEASRKAIGLSATRLARAYKAGTLKAPHRVADIIGLLSLLPSSDPIFGKR